MKKLSPPCRNRNSPIPHPSFLQTQIGSTTCSALHSTQELPPSVYGASTTSAPKAAPSPSGSPTSTAPTAPTGASTSTPPSTANSKPNAVPFFVNVNAPEPEPEILTKM